MTLNIFKRQLSRQELEASLAKFDAETADIVAQIGAALKALPDLLAKEAVNDLSAEEKALLKKIRADKPSYVADQQGRDDARQRIVRALELAMEAEEREGLKRIEESTNAYRQKAAAAYNKVGAALRAVEVALSEADAAERDLPPDVARSLPALLGARQWISLRLSLTQTLDSRRASQHELFEPLARIAEGHDGYNGFFVDEGLQSVRREVGNRSERSAKRAAAGA